MIDTKKIEKLARQVRNALPQSIRNLGDDAEQKIRQVLQTQLTKLDLISRDEFDVQTQVLVRTREKLAQLEKRLSDLETNNPSTATESKKQSTAGDARS